MVRSPGLIPKRVQVQLSRAHRSIDRGIYNLFLYDFLASRFAGHTISEVFFISLGIAAGCLLGALRSDIKSLVAAGSIRCIFGILTCFIPELTVPVIFSAFLSTTVAIRETCRKGVGCFFSRPSKTRLAFQGAVYILLCLATVFFILSLKLSIDQDRSTSRMQLDVGSVGMTFSRHIRVLLVDIFPLHNW